ncbi:hypothetical protein [Patulibacter sp.]|uniref:hypothetical protein n=1 Tax=Patulibacter sp. TaxID=1912859 RepID=UPI0027160E5D|nr:hypothetical protein [Patulibacter sp.]MDO9408298.1 hypothetical protein [Patulibacter sp.]
MDLVLASDVVLAGIVAKGLGVIAIIFGVGALFGAILTSYVASRIRRIRKH